MPNTYTQGGPRAGDADLALSTGKLPPARRRAAWDEAIAQLCGPSATDYGPRFDGRIDRRFIASQPITRLIHNARGMKRTRRHIAEDDPGLLHIILQLRGRSSLSQSGCDTQLLPGDMAMLDSGAPYALGSDQENAQMWLPLPKPELERRMTGASPWLARRITGAPAILLGNLIRCAYGNSSIWSPGQSSAIRDGLTNLVAETWRAPAPGHDLGEDRLVPPVVNAIQNYVMSNLPAPELSAETIAREFGMSVRHLHRLFKLTGMSLTRWIRRCRLDRCAADFLDHSLAAESVTQIAYRWGFEDSSNFSRAFKAEFGLSPRGYRKERPLQR